MCLMTMTSRVFPGSPAARPGSARCPGPTRPRRCASSPASCPISRTCPSCPDRGPGADLTGRTAALLVDIPVEVTPRGWRLAERPGRDLARARTMLSSDLDVMEEVLDGYRGPLKIQLCGPWTLAATLELPRTLNVAIADPGAGGRPDRLAGRRAPPRTSPRSPSASPAPGSSSSSTSRPCPPWPAGEVPTASGLSRLRPVEAEVAAGAAGPGDRRHREVHGGPLLRRRPSRSA